MFDLGFKQVVINDGPSNIRSVDGYIEIDGFGRFEINSSAATGGYNETETPSAPVKGETTLTEPIAYATAGAGSVFEFRFFIEEGKNNGGAGEIRETGQIVYIQVVKELSFGADIVKALDAADHTYLIKGSGPAVTFKDGYEGFTVSRVIATQISGDPICDDRNGIPEDVTGSVTSGDFGVGLPKQVEESILGSTPANANPYRAQVGGNETVLFTEGSEYTAVHFATKGDHVDGIAPHEMLGYGDANTEAQYDVRHYVVYIQSGNSTNGAEISHVEEI